MVFSHIIIHRTRIVKLLTLTTRTPGEVPDPEAEASERSEEDAEDEEEEESAGGEEE